MLPIKVFQEILLRWSLRHIPIPRDSSNPWPVQTHPPPPPFNQYRILSPLQITSQELRPSQTKAPVLLGVRRNRDDQVRSGHAALLLQALGQRRVDGLLLGSVPALLEDLDEDELVRPGEAQVGVLADYLVGLVLGDDLHNVVQ